MAYYTTEEQRLLQKTVREFCEKEIKPLAEWIDTNHEIPLELLRKCGSMGYIAPTLPVEWGGEGLDKLSHTIIIEELSRASASVADVLIVNGVLCHYLITYGNKEMQRKFIPGLVKGEIFGSFALTEPEAGTDAASIKTTAVLGKDEYIVNGNKIFITNAPIADLFIIFAVTDKLKGHRGISFFLAEKETAGLVVGNPERKMGQKGVQVAEVCLDNVRIPKANLLGKEGEGFLAAMQSINVTRIDIAALALGISQACLDESVAYANKRVQFQQKIGKFQAIQMKIAEMATKVDASRMLIRKAASIHDQGESVVKEASMAKLYATSVATEVADEAVQIHGGYGYIESVPVERYYRDARITKIYEGTNEIQKIVISKQVYKDYGY